jgi:5-methylcytosine-specific restriction endonuclease McrA
MAKELTWRQLRRLERIKYLQSLPYKEYLQSKYWKTRSKKEKTWAKHICQLCKKNFKYLDVHHLSYKNLGHERKKDLLVVCRNCHAKLHGVITG